MFAWIAVRSDFGSEDRLDGRFFDATWKLDEIEKLEAKIAVHDVLKPRLALPI